MRHLLLLDTLALAASIPALLAEGAGPSCSTSPRGAGLAASPPQCRAHSLKLLRACASFSRCR